MSVVELRTDELTRLMRDFEAKAGNLTDMLPPLAAMLQTAVEEEFETEGHGQWAPLAPSTLANRRAQGKGAKILQDTGRAAGSVSAEFGDDYAMAYTNVKYMVFHVSDKPRKKIPLRDPFAIDEDEATEEAIDMIYRLLELT